MQVHVPFKQGGIFHIYCPSWLETYKGCEFTIPPEHML
jgi:hypothetical protein